MGFNLNNPSTASGGGASAAVVGNGNMAHNNGQMIGRSFTSAGPIKLTNADGIRDATHFEWEQPGGSGWVDGATAGETIIAFTGAEDFFIEKLRISNFDGPSDSTFSFEIWTGPGKTGIQLVAPTRSTKQYDYEVDEYNSLLPLHGRFSGVYVTVNTAQTTPYKFKVYAICSIAEPLVA
jgi:hypothetical protein